MLHFEMGTHKACQRIVFMNIFSENNSKVLTKFRFTFMTDNLTLRIFIYIYIWTRKLHNEQQDCTLNLQHYQPFMTAA